MRAQLAGSRPVCQVNSCISQTFDLGGCGQEVAGRWRWPESGFGDSILKGDVSEFIGCLPFASIFSRAEQRCK